MKTGGTGGKRATSHVGVVDRGLANMSHCHSDIVKSNFTLKDRAALNQKAFDKCFIFGC
jgi:hypothetical protein